MCSLLLFWEQVNKKLTVREKFKKEEVCKIRVVDKKQSSGFLAPVSLNVGFAVPPSKCKECSDNAGVHKRLR